MYTHSEPSSFLLAPVLEDLFGFTTSARLSFGLIELLVENVNHYTARRQKLSEITEQVAHK